VSQPQDRRQVRVIIELIDHTRAIAERNDRADLSARLAAARERISDPRIRVVIAGQLKQGKSQLLNSLLNMPVARVGDDESTVLVTVVAHADEPTARLIVADGRGGEEALDIPVAELRSDLRRAPQAHGRPVLRVEVGAPSPLLSGGLTFIDTPGVGGQGRRCCRGTAGSGGSGGRCCGGPRDRLAGLAEPDALRGHGVRGRRFPEPGRGGSSAAGAAGGAGLAPTRR
jgi:replication fork clamp-binding protein CrfC